ncbi:MAG TPA: carboxypeptidase-like regulatory domain-containing protein, partial [Terriglobales bacterium]
MNISPAWAQHGSQGKVNVTVLDQQGRVVPGAQLELRDLGTNDLRTATTPDAGTYSFVNLSIGNYKLTVSKPGFETQVVTPLVVEATRTSDVEATLRVGATSQTVEVQGQSTAVETTSNAVTTTITPEQIENLPLNGRNVAQFGSLTPGYVGGANNAGTWNGVPAVAQGNNIDGVLGSPSRMKFGGNANPVVTPRLEGIEEMTVQTDALDLNTGFGQASTQLNFITRRGTNNFHGRIYEDHRNAALNANTWRNDALGIKKAPLILNEFGGSIGGPILHDKLFFFGAFSMSKQPGSITATNSLVAPAAQAGNFVYTGTDGKAHTVNVLDIAHNSNASLPNTLNPAIASQLQKINNALQFGTVASTSDPNMNTLNWLAPAPITFYYPTVRVDFNASQKMRMNLAFNQTHQSQPTSNAAVFPGPDFASTRAGGTFNNYTASYGIDYTISPTIINQFKAGFLYNVNRFAFNAAPLYATAPTVFWNMPGQVQAGGIPGNSISGQNYQLPTTSYYPVFSFSDNVSWQRGAHSFNFGGSWW